MLPHYQYSMGERSRELLLAGSSHTSVLVSWVPRGLHGCRIMIYRQWRAVSANKAEARQWGSLEAGVVAAATLDVAALYSPMSCAGAQALAGTGHS